MDKNTTKKVVIGVMAGLAAGYVAGILTAPKSGKETRQDIKEVTSRAYREVEARLKGAYADLGDLVEMGTKKAYEFSAKGRAQFDKLSDQAVAAQGKLKNALSELRSRGEDALSDEDLQSAMESAQEAKEHLTDFLRRN
jgi:gas vesicle protein